MCLDDRYKMIDTLIRIETRNDKETRRKSMKLIRTEDAVGHVLCHDMTQIIPGVIKDADTTAHSQAPFPEGLLLPWEMADKDFHWYSV